MPRAVPNYYHYYVSAVAVTYDASIRVMRSHGNPELGQGQSWKANNLILGLPEPPPPPLKATVT